MHPAIQIVYDKKRGCGYRKLHGLYFRGDGSGHPCGRLPIPLTTCPCCGAGIKPTRGFTWVNADMLIEASSKKECHQPDCDRCPISAIIKAGIGKAGLLWVGEAYYKSPDDFDREAAEQGISRRIASVPRGFTVGETWVLLAHRKAIVEYKFGAPVKFTAGIFRLFKPTHIEVVCDGNESDETIQDYLKRGLTPVKVERADTPVMQTLESLLEGVGE